MTAFDDMTRRAKRVALDTSACIYFLGGVEPWDGMVRTIVERARDADVELELSSIVQFELLVRPLRERNQAEIDRVMMFTDRGPNLHLAPIDRARLLLGARVRARTRLSTPDSIIVASAALSDCDLVVGNDRLFKRTAELTGERTVFGSPITFPKYIHLDDYVEGA